MPVDTVDPSIYQLVGRGVKSVADYDREAQELQNLQTTGRQNRLALALGQQNFDEAQRANAEQKTLRQALQGATSDDELINRARATGLPAGLQLAGEREKAMLERQRTGAQVQKDAAEAQAKSYELGRKKYEHYVGGLSQFTNPEDAKQWLADGVMRYQSSSSDPTGISFKQASLLMNRVPNDPQEFEKWKNNTIFSLQDSAKQAGYIRPDANAALHAQTTTDTNAATNARTSAIAAADLSEKARHNRAMEGIANDKVLANQQEDASPTTPTLGVPIPKVFPWANQSNAKDANKVKAAEAKAGAKEVDKDTEMANQEQAMAMRAKRFLDLNKVVGTGGLSDQTRLGRGLQSLGPNYSEMESISAELAPRMRVPGSGATSDFDAKQFERAIVGVNKPRQTNENIANALISRAQQSQDYADFRQTYLEQNGTLTGAARHWKQYTDKNPIFDPKAKTGQFALNPGREDWKAFFGRQTGASSGAAPAAQPVTQPTNTTSGTTSGTSGPKFLGFE